VVFIVFGYWCAEEFCGSVPRVGDAIWVWWRFEILDWKMEKKNVLE
jgi:hypothetical protein